VRRRGQEGGAEASRERSELSDTSSASDDEIGGL
jgi:hypothetical protein